MRSRMLETSVLLAMAALYGVHAHATESFPSSPIDDESCSREFPENCLNGVTNAVTSIDALRVTGVRVAETTREKGEAEQHAALVYPGAAGGLPAGETTFGGFGVWAGYNRASFDSSFPVAPYDATLDAVTVGVDRLFQDRFLLGVAIGYEQTESRTFFNGGGQETDGVLVAPYAAWLIDEVWSVDVSGGYTALDTDQTRIDPVTGGILRGEFDADRWFVAGNLNAVVRHGDWVLGARAGILYTDEEQDGFDEVGGPSARSLGERNVDLTQASVGFDAGYSLGAFEPYALVGYRNDLSRDDGRDAGGLPAATGPTQADDDDEVEVGLGLRYFGDGALSGGFEWIWTTGREDFDNNSLMLTLRLDL